LPFFIKFSQFFTEMCPFYHNFSATKAKQYLLLSLVSNDCASKAGMMLLPLYCHTIYPLAIALTNASSPIAQMREVADEF